MVDGNNVVMAMMMVDGDVAVVAMMDKEVARCSL